MIVTGAPVSAGAVDEGDEGDEADDVVAGVSARGAGSFAHPVPVTSSSATIAGVHARAGILWQVVISSPFWRDGTDCARNPGRSAPRHDSDADRGGTTSIAVRAMW
jgi:hypothetical protein